MFSMWSDKYQHNKVLLNFLFLFGCRDLQTGLSVTESQGNDTTQVSEHIINQFGVIPGCELFKSDCKFYLKTGICIMNKSM